MKAKGWAGISHLPISKYYIKTPEAKVVFVGTPQYNTWLSIVTVVFPGPSYEPCLSNPSLAEPMYRPWTLVTEAKRGICTGNRTADSGSMSTDLHSVQSLPRIIFISESITHVCIVYHCYEFHFYKQLTGYR